MTGGGEIIGRQGTSAVAVPLTAVGLDLLVEQSFPHVLVGGSAVALRIAVTVLAVLVAGAQPLLVFVASAPPVLLLTRPRIGAGAVARPVVRRDPVPTDPGLVRCLPRRGPPGVVPRA
ncbi:hypothetical protein [Actinomycetospora atypica]|uniref:Uncharacterized protein n=1 Tax=Actinomycetospora atypica TaxID=1290095 RepID=A0ABV9YPI4_9PSEU